MPMMPPLLRHLQGTCDRPVPYCTRAFDQQRNDRKPGATGIAASRGCSVGVRCSAVNRCPRCARPRAR
jgi:hypothetical protein